MKYIEIDSYSKKIIEISLTEKVYSFYEKEANKCDVHNIVVPIGYYLARGSSDKSMLNMLNFNEKPVIGDKDTLAFMIPLVAKQYNLIASRYKTTIKDIIEQYLTIWANKRVKIL